MPSLIINSSLSDSIVSESAVYVCNFTAHAPDSLATLMRFLARLISPFDHYCQRFVHSCTHNCAQLCTTMGRWGSLVHRACVRWGMFVHSCAQNCAHVCTIMCEAGQYCRQLCAQLCTSVHMHGGGEAGVCTVVDTIMFSGALA